MEETNKSNENRLRFTLSYDLIDTSEGNNEKFRKDFIVFLLSNNAEGIKSYSDSNIIFSSNIIMDYDFWETLIRQVFKSRIYYFISEVAKRTEQKNEHNVGSFKSKAYPKIEFSNNFDSLVLDIKSQLDQASSTQNSPT